MTATIERCPECRRRVGSVYHDMVCGPCTCPRLDAEPLARTGTNPDCPIHGERG